MSACWRTPVYVQQRLRAVLSEASTPAATSGRRDLRYPEARYCQKASTGVESSSTSSPGSSWRARYHIDRVSSVQRSHRPLLHVVHLVSHLTLFGQGDRDGATRRPVVILWARFARRRPLRCLRPALALQASSGRHQLGRVVARARTAAAGPPIAVPATGATRRRRRAADEPAACRCSAFVDRPAARGPHARWRGGSASALSHGGAVVPSLATR